MYNANGGGAAHDLTSAVESCSLHHNFMRALGHRSLGFWGFRGQGLQWEIIGGQK